MKKKTDMLRKYLLNETDTDTELRRKGKLQRLIRECYSEYDQADDTEKLLILKDIVALVLKLIYGEDQEVYVEMGKSGTI